MSLSGKASLEPGIHSYICDGFWGARRFPTWLLSDGRQVPQGLDTDVMLPHTLVNMLQMAAPRAAIWSHLATGVSACAGIAHACPTKFFYKSSAHRTSGLTFG